MNAVVLDNAMDKKQRIARQFSRAAPAYDHAAQVQLDIAFDAIETLPEQLATVLDIGCGTGRITHLLAARSQRTLAVDLAEGMLQFAQKSYSDPNISWLVGDAEQLPLLDSCVDTVFSSMALQWCMPIDSAMQQLYRVLKPGGTALLALLSEGALRELAQAWQTFDNVPHVNQFAPHAQLCAQAQQQGFTVKSQVKEYITWHHSVREVLASIKAIGANVVPQTRNKTPLNRQAIQRLDTHYQSLFAQNGQVPLTYTVSFLTLRKPQ